MGGSKGCPSGAQASPFISAGFFIHHVIISCRDTASLPSPALVPQVSSAYFFSTREATAMTPPMSTLLRITAMWFWKLICRNKTITQCRHRRQYLLTYLLTNLLTYFGLFARWEHSPSTMVLYSCLFLSFQLVFLLSPMSSPSYHAASRPGRKLSPSSGDEWLFRSLPCLVYRS